MESSICCQNSTSDGGELPDTRFSHISPKISPEGEQLQISKSQCQSIKISLSKESLIWIDESGSEENVSQNPNELLNNSSIKNDSSEYGLNRSCFELESPKMIEDKRKVASCSSSYGTENQSKELLDLNEMQKCGDMFCEEKTKRLNLSDISKFVAHSCDGIYYDNESVANQNMVNESNISAVEEQNPVLSLPNKEEDQQPLIPSSIDNNTFSSGSQSSLKNKVICPVDAQCDSNSSKNPPLTAMHSPVLCRDRDLDTISKLSREDTDIPRKRHNTTETIEWGNYPTLSNKCPDNIHKKGHPNFLPQLFRRMFCMSVNSDSEDSVDSSRQNKNVDITQHDKKKISKDRLKKTFFGKKWKKS